MTLLLVLVVCVKKPVLPKSQTGKKNPSVSESDKAEYLYSFHCFSLAIARRTTFLVANEKTKMFQTRAEFFMDHVIGEHRNFSEVCTPFAALSFHQLFFVRMISQKSAHLFYCSEREMSREQTLNFFFVG